MWYARTHTQNWPNLFRVRFMWRGCWRKAGKLWGAGAFFLPPQGIYYPVSYIIYIQKVYIIKGSIRHEVFLPGTVGCCSKFSSTPLSWSFSASLVQQAGRGCCRSLCVCFLVREMDFFCFSFFVVLWALYTVGHFIYFFSDCFRFLCPKTLFIWRTKKVLI